MEDHYRIHSGVTVLSSYRFDIAIVMLSYCRKEQWSSLTDALCSVDPGSPYEAVDEISSSAVASADGEEGPVLSGDGAPDGTCLGHCSTGLLNCYKITLVLAHFAPFYLSSSSSSSCTLAEYRVRQSVGVANKLFSD